MAHYPQYRGRQGSRVTGRAVRPTATATIAAIATASGPGAIGVVRISGTQAARIAARILGQLPPPRFARFCPFRDAAGATIDQGVALYFPAPASFTGEDVVELHAHGGPVVVDLLLRQALMLGARLALPGEFSERAFLNGKMDLTQAEAIADLIASGSEQAARAAIASLQGEFSRRVVEIGAAVDRLRVEIEASLDFPEEEAVPPPPFLLADLRAAIAAIGAALQDARRGALLSDGIHVVIAGRPNAGKSSLFNYMARCDRAIVSATAGTTRDTLDVDIQLDGLPVHLTDTAGLRESEEEIEREGVRRAQAALRLAHHVLLLVPCNEAYDEQDLRLLAQLPACATSTAVRTKIDLCNIAPRIDDGPCGREVWVSVRANLGIHDLELEIQKAAGYEDRAEGAFSARRRHIEALGEARAALSEAHIALDSRATPELAAEHLRLARRALSLITGEYTTEDLLGEIFRSFCIGK